MVIHPVELLWLQLCSTSYVRVCTLLHVECQSEVFNAFWVQEWQRIIGNRDRKGKPTGLTNYIHDPTYSFLAGSFEGMPPLYVIVGSLDWNTAFLVAKCLCDILRMADAGGEAVFDIAPYQQHCPAYMRIATLDHLQTAGIARFIKNQFQ